MLDSNDFVQATKDILAKRAGQKCSNPSCRRPTVGPHSDDARAVNVGEAAHIRGARPGSARYDSSMTPDERRIITNGIWLCRSCAAMVDRDELRYPVEGLYKWKREHEVEQLALIGGPSELVEERQRTGRIFENESPAALQLALDRPVHWEYLLTAELTREKLRHIRRQISELHDGLIYVPAKFVTIGDLPIWLKERSEDLVTIMKVLENIVVHQLAASSAKGTADEILRTANLLSDACRGLLRWEEQVAGVRFPDSFEDMQPSMRGWTNDFLNEMERIPTEISNTINAGIRGEHHITITFSVPESVTTFAAEFSRRIDRIVS
jgi:hypothetical protein